MMFELKKIVKMKIDNLSPADFIEFYILTFKYHLTTSRVRYIDKEEVTYNPPKLRAFNGASYSVDDFVQDINDLMGWWKIIDDDYEWSTQALMSGIFTHTTTSLRTLSYDISNSTLLADFGFDGSMQFAYQMIHNAAQLVNGGSGCKILVDFANGNTNTLP